MDGENPPIGLILCDKKNDALAHYTLENLPNKILASEYKMILPDEKILEEEIVKAKRLIRK
ncbi:MAG TPA: PDDEXK nuclease domain-containing protein [Pyrinomonadaceae bacterium]|nr:PDDEXK nuclease domain-containing protein [Pyrinomonadaceae bacterium]